MSVDFFWTIASGASRKALRVLSGDSVLDTDVSLPLDSSVFDEPETLMISFATEDNTPWEGPDWVLDSGGYSTLSANRTYQQSISDYLDHVEAHEDCFREFALRDWACEPDLLDQWGRSVETHQEWTLRDHITTLEAAQDRGIDADPMAVLQGYDVRDYLTFIDELRDHGLLTNRVGIGSICRRHASETIRHTIFRIREALPPRVHLHGFGVKQTMLESDDILGALDSVDSNAWDARLFYDATTEAHDGPAHYRNEWLDYRKPRYPSANWRNTLLAYQSYRQRLGLGDAASIEPAESSEPAATTTVRSLADYTASKDDADGYVLLECLCGTVFDPGAPTHDTSSTCRHCESLLLNLWDRHLSRREQVLHGPYPQTCTSCGDTHAVEDLLSPSAEGQLQCPDCHAPVVDQVAVHDPFGNSLKASKQKDAHRSEDDAEAVSERDDTREKESLTTQQTLDV